tara:strand:- start:153 stop:431 length:279 start_codon:yes stop_codon:yes gene_type:complete
MDKKHRKKLKRTAKKKKDKAVAKKTQDKMKKQIGMFDLLPKECSACEKVFPKTREAHMSWRVVVRDEEKQVRLFCPECQNKVNELLESDDEV